MRPDRGLDYDNLLYSCVTCNLGKGSRRTPDPTAVLVAPGVRVTEDGSLHADNPAAARVIELVGLNRPRLCEFRGIWIGIIRLADAVDPVLYRRLMGFPAELPNLRRLRPPRGNRRPEGVEESWFAQRLRGSLPPTY